jgi:hypothetical protein
MPIKPIMKILNNFRPIRSCTNTVALRSIAFALLVIESNGCASTPLPKTFVQCNSTDTCQAQKRARDYAFAKAVADEPPAIRLDVEVVTGVVLLDIQKQTVYALDPTFTALELQTGRKKQRIEGLSGDRLWRVGTWLVVSNEATSPVHLTFIDPAKLDAKPITCTPQIPMPKEAATVDVLPFDRAGQPYFYWHSAYYYRGGTPPGEAIKIRQEKADACGIMRIDVATCKTQSVAFNDFLWEPPEGRLKREGEKDFCYFLSPLLDIPAAAASAPRTAAGWGQLTPATRAPMLAVRAEKGSGNACNQVTYLTLEARNEASTVLWTHPLASVSTNCGPP